VKVWLSLLVVLFGLCGCGYKVSGKADLLPDKIGAIAIPAFENITTRYRLTQKMATAMTREFTARSRYRIVANPQNADATLFGAVVNFFSYPTIFDSRTGRAAGMQVIVVLNLRLVEEGTGKLLYQASGMSIQSRYEISTDQEAYFEESDTALERIGDEVARKAVAAILEDF
jgi:lipopolysaccharide assembly LptE-like protein